MVKEWVGEGAWRSQSHYIYKSSQPHFLVGQTTRTYQLLYFFNTLSSFSHSLRFSYLNPSPTLMAALAGSSSAATPTTSSARFRRFIRPPPSQLHFTRARFSVKAACPFFSDNNNSLPQNVVVSKPSPLELLKTAAADSESSSFVLHWQICQNLNLIDDCYRVWI